jgi:ribulose kinase
VDGGASANNWLLQFQSDVLGIPVERPDMIETTALGAAGLAGIAGGVWRDAAEFIGKRQFTRFTPVMPKESAEQLMGEWQRAVRAALFWARDKGDAAEGKKRAGTVKKRSAKRSAPRKRPSTVGKARRSAPKSASKKAKASKGRKR